MAKKIDRSGQIYGPYRAIREVEFLVYECECTKCGRISRMTTRGMQMAARRKSTECHQCKKDARGPDVNPGTQCGNYLILEDADSDGKYKVQCSQCKRVTSRSKNAIITAMQRGYRFCNYCKPHVGLAAAQCLEIVDLGGGWFTQRKDYSRLSKAEKMAQYFINRGFLV